MGEPGKRIGLVHELAQLTGTEELLDRGDDRPDVDQRLRRDRLRVLGCHPLPDHTLQPAQPNPDLVLDQLTDGTDTPVLEVVDVIDAESVLATVEGDQVPNRAEDVLVGKHPVFGDAVLIEVDLGKTEFLVQLVATDTSEVVPLRVAEQGVDQPSGRFDGGQLSRPQLAVQVEQCLVLGVGRVLFQGVGDELRAVEQGEDLLVGLCDAEGADERRHELATFAINPDPNRFLLVDVELEPGTTARDDLARIQIAVGCLVDADVVVDPGAANQLAYDNALGSVDDEGAVVGHHREVTEKDLLLFDLTGLAVEEPGGYEQRVRIVAIAVLGLFDCLCRVTESMVGELEREVSCEVFDRRDFLEHLAKATLEEDLE